MDGSKPVTADIEQTGSLTQALATSRIPGLDFLRALAVLAVLVDHSGAFTGDGPNLFNGATGVQMFFVLSGFLITWMLLDETQRKGRIDLRAFYLRRFARLMPVFYAYVLVGTGMLLLAHKLVPWGALAASLVYGLNYYQALNGAPTHFLSHCWSLAVEEQFYFIWPLTLAFMLRAGMRLDKSIVVLLLCVWVYRAGAQLLGLASDEYIYRALEMRADHLLIGCLLAVLLKQASVRSWFERIQAKYPWLLLVLFAVLSISGSYDGNLNYRYSVGYIIEPIATTLLLPLLIICAQNNGGPFAWFVNSSLVVKVGQASYGIYLFHQLLLYSMQTRLAAWTHSPLVGFLIAVTILSVLAHLSYTYFEMPIRRRLHPKS